MAITKLEKRDFIVIEALIKTINAEIYKLYKKFEGSYDLNNQVTKLYNFKDLINNLENFDYFIGVSGTLKEINKILDALQADDDLKDSFAVTISTLSSISNKRFSGATPEEKELGKTIYVTHFRKYVMTSEKYAYRNKFKPSKSLVKVSRKLKDSDKNIIVSLEHSIAKEKASIVCDEYQYVNNNKFQNIFVTAANEYFSIFSFENELNIDLKIYPDGSISISKGKVSLSEEVEIKQPTVSPDSIEDSDDETKFESLMEALEVETTDEALQEQENDHDEDDR